MIVYGSSLSPFVRKVLSFGAEKGLELELRRTGLGSDDAAARSVKKKFFDEMCGAGKDTRFFVGTRFPYNTWFVIGVFWPPKITQPSLFP